MYIIKSINNVIYTENYSITVVLACIVNPKVVREI